MRGGRAPSADADILVFSAHHDSVPTAYGANDNASGVTALLAVAEALKDVPTDTELRFISFTDEENGKNGSRQYTSGLSARERERMIGDIQLDMLGGMGTDGLSVCTMDGETNWLSELLLRKSPGASLAAETASDHAAFSGRTLAIQRSEITTATRLGMSAGTARIISMRTSRTRSRCSCWATSPRAIPWRQKSCVSSGTTRRCARCALRCGTIWGCNNTDGQTKRRRGIPPPFGLSKNYSLQA